MKNEKKILLGIAAFLLISMVTVSVCAQDDYNWTSDPTDWVPWIGGAFCIIAIVMFIIAIVLAIWVYKDAEKRKSSGAYGLSLLYSLVLLD